MNKKGNKSNKKSARNGNKHANFKMMVQVPQLRVRLPYFFYGGLTESAAGLGAAYTFAINNIFDPDFSGGGLQPLGFDQYTQLYGRYRVLGFQARVDFGNRTANPSIVGMYLSPQSTLPAVASAWPVVNPTSVFRTIAGNAGGLTTCSLNLRANLPDVFGVTKSEYANEMDFAALVSSSPARQAYLHVFIIGRAAAGTTDFSVKLNYDVEFSQAVALSLS